MDPQKPNWDDYRFVLAVARTGSVSAAARELDVNHATVLRRVAAVEAYLGTVLFEKSVRGYEISPDRLRLIEAAREVEAAVNSVERMAKAGDAPLAGVIRVTSTDSIMYSLMPQIIARLGEQEKELSFELISTNQHLDLSRLHADVTVRPTDNLPDDLSGEIAGHMSVAFYGKKNAPSSKWIGLSGAISNSLLSQQLTDALADLGAKPTCAADSFVTLMRLCEAGGGNVILPRVLGDGSKQLQRIEGPIETGTVPLYVASHVDLADVPRLRRARELLVREIGLFADFL